ncbi:MAG TPA: hypothetical protein PLA19_01020 [Candidatus Pacearchaeota archaeon]|nr:hypothetical protein [Candidatus Pacearchaeota archaeon]
MNFPINKSMRLFKHSFGLILIFFAGIVGAQCQTEKSVLNGGSSSVEIYPCLEKSPIEGVINGVSMILVIAFCIIIMLIVARLIQKHSAGKLPGCLIWIVVLFLIAQAIRLSY